MFAGDPGRRGAVRRTVAGGRRHQRDESPLAAVADSTVLMHAGEERGGVSCRSYTHTQVLLLALEATLTGVDRDLLAILGRSADAPKTSSTDGTPGFRRLSSTSQDPT